jgi:alanyl-tRNA synthetase
MKSDELRKIFLGFFEKRGHPIESPASLVPKNDPSLLFTGAGMNQFKELFSGRSSSSLKRAVTCQRCLRATDIENVGRTGKHLTFLEMLGNFSFGDYFKEEAAAWAWEFMTEVLKLPEEKLIVTVYKDDDETLRIWQEKIGIRRERISLLGEEDNFWDMGKTGPCGPCSEIVIDRGEEYGCGKDSCGPACDCDRHLELWNLVFTQFNRREDGKLEPLQQKNIDTGLGLERIVGVMQGALSVFDIDLIQPIVSEIRSAKPETAGAGDERAARIIADHIRAITFCLADGILPSNEGRGYVLRKLIRRAVQQGRNLGEKKPFLYRLVPLVINCMSSFYPELSGRNNDIGVMVKAEEEKFFTVFRKLPELEEKIRELAGKGEKQLPGDVCFKYYDTYGIPQETITELAQSMDMKADKEGFKKALDSQRRRARDASGFANSRRELPEIKGTTEFTGYEKLESDGKILTIIRDRTEVTEAREGENISVVTDRTPFYGETGGQTGDEGEITGEKWQMKVSDTKRAGEAIIHEGVLTRGTLLKGDTARLSVNGERRKGIAASHTATHLLHYSLRRILGKHIRQSGSLVGPGKLRFDFTHTSAVSARELSEIEELVNNLIMENSPVETLELPLKEALKMGAIALFDEKYGKSVRVLKVGSYSRELCGGTHVRSTGEIGAFLIENESSVAAGVRRIEAISGGEAYSEIKRAKLTLSELSQILKATPADVVIRVKKLLETTRTLQKKLEALRVEEAVSGIENYLSQARTVNGIKVFASVQERLSRDGLRQLVDELKAKMESGIVVLGTVSDGKVCLLTGVTKDLVKQGWNAGKLVKEIASIVEGSGGGRADFAQAGGKNVHRLKEAIEAVPEIIKGRAQSKR